MRHATVMLVVLTFAASGCVEVPDVEPQQTRVPHRACDLDVPTQQSEVGRANTVRFLAEIRGMPGTVHMCVFGPGEVLYARSSQGVESGRTYVFDVPVKGPVAMSSAFLVGEGVAGGTIKNHEAPDCPDGTYTNANAFNMQGRSYVGESANADACKGQAMEFQGASMPLDVATDPPAWGGALVVASASALVVFVWRRGWLAVPLFTRLARPKILDQAVRAEIHQALVADPGLRASDLARRLDLSHGHMAYHLGVLKAQGILTSVRVGGRSHYFLAGTRAPTDMRRVAALQRPGWRKAFAQVQASPGAAVGQIAQRLQWSVARTSRVVVAMERARIVRRETQGRQTLVFPS